MASPMALTTTTRSFPAARSRAIRRATRLMRSASATDEPPILLDDEGGRHSVGILPPESRLTRVHDQDGTPQRAAAMCFDLDSRPPIPPIAGGALDSERVTLDGPRRQPPRRIPGLGCRADRRRARRSFPTSAGSIPTTRSSRCGSPSTASTRSPSTGSGGPPGPSARGDDFEHMPHVGRDDLGRDLRRHRGGRRRHPRAAWRPAGAGRGSSRWGSAWAAGCRSWRARSASTWRASSGSTARSSGRGGTTPRRRSTSRPRSPRRSWGCSAARTRRSRPRPSRRSMRP